MIKALLIPVFLLVSLQNTTAKENFYAKKDPQTISFPFYTKGNLMIIECKLEGIIPLNLIFDTGAEFSLLFKKPVIDLLKINYAREVKVIGADRTQILSAFPMKGIKFDLGLHQVSMDFLLLKEDYFEIESYVGFKVDGILGSNFFKDFIVQVDNRKRVIILHSPGKSHHIVPHNYKEIKAQKVKDRLFVPCQIEMTNGKRSTVDLLIDSGAATSVLFFLNSDSSLMNISTRIVPTKIGMGLGGYLNGYLAKVKFLKISQFILHELIINYQETDSLYLESNFSRKNGMVGNQILKRFDYYLDYENEKVYLNSNRKFTQKIRTDKSGIILLASGPYLNHFYIAYIHENSSGAESGLKVGDEIISINGRPKFTLSLDKIYNLFSGREGKEYTIKIRRDGKKERYNLVLENKL